MIQLLVVPAGGRGKWGGIFTFINTIRREHLEQAGLFHEHSTHVLGLPVIDPPTQRITLVVSTLNMLLNAYRQIASGFPPFVAVDATCRVVIEGHCFMPVCTSSGSIKCHIIAYAVCNNEDKASHYTVIKTVYDAVCDAVNEMRVSNTHI